MPESPVVLDNNRSASRRLRSLIQAQPVCNFFFGQSSVINISAHDHRKEGDIC